MVGTFGQTPVARHCGVLQEGPNRLTQSMDIARASTICAGIAPRNGHVRTLQGAARGKSGLPLRKTCSHGMTTYRASFGTHLSRIGALHFASTAFTTVGYGEMSAESQAARVLTTGRLRLDVLIQGFGIRLVVNAIKVGQKRHSLKDTEDLGLSALPKGVPSA